MQKSIAIAILVSAALVGGAIYFAPGVPAPAGEGSAAQMRNVEIKDGIQYVTIAARGGYSPGVSEARADIPTKLIVKTDGTYDCSAALVIRSIGYQKILPPTGEEIIDLGAPQAGTLRGLCSMGMYSFSVNFK